MRCFIAIELSQEIKTVLAATQAGLKPAFCGDIKWVDPENIHLTLKFLGEIDAALAEKTKSIIDEIASRTMPFTIRLSSAGAFPSPGWPSVLWVGIDIGKDGCINLAGRIEEKLAPLGVEKEPRPFHPHLTIARVKSLHGKQQTKGILESLKVQPVEMALSKMALFQSTLTSAGPIYTKLSESVIG